MTIVVATDDFQIYHSVVTELRDRNARFTTIQPNEVPPEGTTVIITGPNDELLTETDAFDHVVAHADNPRQAVHEALASGRGNEDRRVIGIDPGTKPGIAVLEGDDIVAAFQIPRSQAADVVRREAKGVVEPVVKIGDGARIQGAKLIDELSNLHVELVDETGSTPHLGTGARGMGDVLAAINIARRKGDHIEHRDIEPTAGEIQVIKTESRERSSQNRSITDTLARQVAKGELTIEEALDEHEHG